MNCTADRVINVDGHTYAGYYEMVCRCGLFMSAKRLMEIERFSIKYVHGCRAKQFLIQSQSSAVVRWTGREIVSHTLCG